MNLREGLQLAAAALGPTRHHLGPSLKGREGIKSRSLLLETEPLSGAFVGEGQTTHLGGAPLTAFAAETQPSVQ